MDTPKFTDLESCNEKFFEQGKRLKKEIERTGELVRKVTDLDALVDQKNRDLRDLANTAGELQEANEGFRETIEYQENFIAELKAHKEELLEQVKIQGDTINTQMRQIVDDQQRILALLGRSEG
jgi:chromosome segregation ATPase